MNFGSLSTFCRAWTSVPPGRNSSTKPTVPAVTNMTYTATSAWCELLYSLGHCLFQSSRLQSTEPDPSSFQLKTHLLERYELSHWNDRKAGESGSESKEAQRETRWPELWAKAHLRDIVGVLLTSWDIGCNGEKEFWNVPCSSQTLPSRFRALSQGHPIDWFGSCVRSQMAGVQGWEVTSVVGVEYCVSL